MFRMWLILVDGQAVEEIDDADEATRRAQALLDAYAEQARATGSIGIRTVKLVLVTDAWERNGQGTEWVQARRVIEAEPARKEGA